MDCVTHNVIVSFGRNAPKVVSHSPRELEGFCDRLKLVNQTCDTFSRALHLFFFFLVRVPVDSLYLCHSLTVSRSTRGAVPPEHSLH